MTHLPTNAMLTVKRKSAAIDGLTDLPAFVEPADPMIASAYDIPASKGFHIIFKSIVDIREQDFLIEGVASYRVVGVEHHKTRRFAHTEVTASAIWGTD